MLVVLVLFLVVLLLVVAILPLFLMVEDVSLVEQVEFLLEGRGLDGVLLGHVDSLWVPVLLPPGFRLSLR